MTRRSSEGWPTSSSPRGGARCRPPSSPVRGGLRGCTPTWWRAPASASTSCSRTAPCARCRRSTGGSTTATIDGQRVGEATFEVPGDLPVGWHRLVAHLDVAAVDPRTVEATLVVTPQRLELPAAVARGARHRPDGAALPGALGRVVGRRRPRRPRRPGHLGRGRARRRLRADQPAARRRAGRARGAVALPADHPAVREPPVPARRGRARARAARPRGLPPGRDAGRRGQGAQPGRPDRP